MKAFVFLLLLTSLEATHAADALEALVARIGSTASPESGMDEAEQKLADDIAVYKTQAADLLIPLLKSDDKAVRQLAGYCLNKLPKGSLLNSHLAALTEACGKERGWLPNAIADIDSEDAVSFLAKDFRKLPETEAQIDNALVRTAPASIEPLLHEFEEADESESDFLEKLAQIWQTMGRKAGPAVAPLLAVALDLEAPHFRRLSAVRYLGAIGPTAQNSFAELKELAVREPDLFKEAVASAIAGSGTSEAAEIMLPAAVSAARNDGELYLFRDLSELRENAAQVADKLANLLDDPDPNVRLGACRTLGYTTRLDLWPVLARALKDDDWRVAFAACASLSQLKARGAVASLQALASSHWYPRVKHAARCAEYRVQGMAVPEADRRHLGFSDEVNEFFFDFQSEDSQLAPVDGGAFGVPEPGRDGYAWGSARDVEPGSGSFKELHPELHKSISKLPKSKDWGDFCSVVGLVEQDGFHLVALAAGEWVGGLFVVSRDGVATSVLDDDVTALIKWDNRPVTLSGMYHMGMDGGSVHEVVLEDGKWIARFLYALPGCPFSGGVLPDGRLVANCSGGAVAIGKDGHFEYLGSGKAKPEEGEGLELE